MVRCPFCGSGETELMSLFGQQLLTVQFYCHGCRTPFEKVKDQAVLEAAGRPESERLGSLRAEHRGE